MSKAGCLTSILHKIQCEFGIEKYAILTNVAPFLCLDTERSFYELQKNM